MKNITIILSLLSATLFAQPGIEWSYNFGGSGDESIAGVLQTSDGNFVLAGRTNSDDHDISSSHGVWEVWVAKFDASGTILWEHSYGGTLDDTPLELIQTNDGGFAIAGYSNSPDGDVGGTNGVRDFWVLKLNSAGVLEWAETYGGSGDDRAYSIAQTNDDGFIVTGYTNSDDGDVIGQHGQDDLWVIKLSSSGALQWQNTLGGTDSEQGFSVEQTNDGGYMLCGRAGSSDGDVSANYGDWDVWIVKLTSSGSIDWEKNFGGSSTDNGIRARQTADGGFIFTANTWSEDEDVTGAHDDVELWNVKLDATGDIEWQRAMGGWAGDYAGDVWQSADGGFVSVGTTRSDDGDISSTPDGYDVWMIKSDALGVIEWEFTAGGGAQEDGYYLAPTMDGGYIIGGQTLSDDGDVPGNYGSRDLWIIKVEGEPVSVQENRQNEWSVGPVPSDGALFVSLKNPVHNVIIELVDLSGRVVWQSLINGTLQPFQLDAVAPGPYLLRLELEDGVQVRQVVLR